MTDRKQEVISRISDELHNALSIGADFKYYHFTQSAEALYNRIAPLIKGEFPEELAIEAVNNLIHHDLVGYINGGAVCESHVYTLILQLFKRLWEGQPQGDSDNKGIYLTNNQSMGIKKIKKALEEGLPELEKRLEKIEDANRADPRVLDRKIIGNNILEQEKEGFDCQWLAERRSGEGRRVGSREMAGLIGDKDLLECKLFTKSRSRWYRCRRILPNRRKTGESPRTTPDVRR